MGGNALKQTTTRRYEADEYHRLADLVIAALRKAAPGVRFEVVRAVGDKTSFGDMDVLTDLAADRSMKELVAQTFGDREMVQNGTVLSFPVAELQVDLLRHPGDEFDTARIYFAWNDAGNLQGRIAHRMGFKYGFKGLHYCLRDGTHLVEEIEVSRDMREVFAFLGFDQAGSDFARFDQGFESLAAMFDFVASSRYFDPSAFPLEHRSHKARTRDRKRPTYMAFLRYVAERFGPQGEPTRDDARALERALVAFPVFAARLSAAQERLKRQRAVKARFNGALVASLTGLSGQALGRFMASFTSTFESREAFHEWVLATDADGIADRVRLQQGVQAANASCS